MYTQDLAYVRTVTIGALLDKLCDLPPDVDYGRNRKQMEEILVVILAQAAEFYDCEDDVRQFAVEIAASAVAAYGIGKYEAKTLTKGMALLADYLLQEHGSEQWDPRTLDCLRQIRAADPYAAQELATAAQ